jgi:glutathione S-transferase
MHVHATDRDDEDAVVERLNRLQERLADFTSEVASGEDDFVVGDTFCIAMKTFVFTFGWRALVVTVGFDATVSVAETSRVTG